MLNDRFDRFGIAPEQPSGADENRRNFGVEAKQLFEAMEVICYSYSLISSGRHCFTNRL